MRKPTLVPLRADRRLARTWLLAPWLVVSVGLAGCGDGSTQGTSRESAASTAPRPAPDLSTASHLRGRVTTTALALPGPPLTMDADAICAKAHPEPVRDQRLRRSADGGLENVFVYISSGLEGYGFVPPERPVQLVQDGCLYTPRVLGVQSGQTLDIINRDPTLHNVHAAAKANPAFNIGQPRRDMVSHKIFANPEVMVPFKCDVHPWMAAFVGVVDHPYFAVTAADGSFALDGLPAGRYTVALWHETLGTTSREVVLEPNGQLELAVTMDPPGDAR